MFVREGFKKKVGNFPLGGGPENFENFSHFFKFIFKHGLKTSSGESANTNRPTEQATQLSQSKSKQQKE